MPIKIVDMEWLYLLLAAAFFVIAGKFEKDYRAKKDREFKSKY